MITYKIEHEKKEDRFRVDLVIGGIPVYSVYLPEYGSIYSLKHISESFLYFLEEAEKKETPTYTKD